jgi:hypothetical protein
MRKLSLWELLIHHRSIEDKREEIQTADLNLGIEDHQIK